MQLQHPIINTALLNYGAFPNEGKLLSINSLRVRKQGQKLIKILCVAKITPRKGQIYLLNAVGLLREKYQNNLTIELTFVGIPDQDYFNVLSESEVEFIHIQHINNSDMSEFMSNFDLFVLPSIEDGFAVVISEALSIGLPVITTSTTGAADIVQQINPALVIPPADSQALADAILNVIDNKINYNPVYLAGWADYAVQVYDAIVSNLKVKVTS